MLPRFQQQLFLALWVSWNPYATAWGGGGVWGVGGVGGCYFWARMQSKLKW